MSSLSESTAQRCQAAITQKLRDMLGEEGVEILTDYVWHMVTRPDTTKEHVSDELREFLGNETIEFVGWLIATIGPIINEEVTAKKTQELIPVAAPPADDPMASGGGSGAAEETVTTAQPAIGVHPGPGFRRQKYTPPVSNAGTAARKIKKRCAKFPNCTFGDDCKYIHPSEQCVNWPHCTFGDECFYIHPSVPCRYGINCPDIACNYTHPEEWDKSEIGTRFNAYTGQFKNFTYTCTE